MFKMDATSGEEMSAQTQIRQHKVVAELGQQALETDDCDQLMHDASVAVAEILDNEYAKVLELLPDGDSLFLRQGVGWCDGLVGEATVPTDLDSQAGYTLRSEEPIIVDDLRTEDRFSGPDLLTDHNVVSGISVIIGSVDEPWGVLGVYTTEQREFTEHDANFVKSVANVLASAIENTQTERRFEAIFNDPNILVGLLEADGSVVDINATAMEYIDATLADVTGEPFWETPWWGKDDATQSDVREWTTRAAAGEYVEFEADLTKPNGEQYTLNGVFRPVTNDEGDVVSILISDRDITERKQRERDLAESEAKFRMVAENLDEIVWMMAPDTKEFRYVNPTYENVFGGAREHLYEDAYAFAEYLHPEDRNHVLDEFNKLPDEQYEAEYRIIRPDGEVRWIHEQATQVYDENGDVTRIVGIANDITDRKKRETELKRAFDLLEKTERIAGVGGWEINPETQEVFWTDHIFDLLAVPSDEEPPLDEALDMYHEDDYPVVQRAVDEALDSGEPFDIEVRVHTFSDEVRWLRLQGVPETDNGDVVSFRGAAHDITEHKERERRLEEVIAQLETSNERLEQFAYAASHDLQEPLRMVSSYLQLIERRYDDELDEEGEEFLEFAIDGAERMRAMIDGLLAYSRVESDGEPFLPVELDAVLTDVLTDLQFQMENNDAEIIVEDLPCVLGDAGQLRQVFRNLIENAIEYRGDEPPRIHVSASRNNNKWTISVTDHGIGIPLEEQDRVFEVFKRLHSRHEHAGTGIGLALCERIIERHGGEIWVESKLGEGATFSFTLSAADT